MSTYNCLDLQTVGSRLIINLPKIFRDMDARVKLQARSGITNFVVERTNCLAIAKCNCVHLHLDDFIQGSRLVVYTRAHEVVPSIVKILSGC